jgi:hypothetical protein
MMLSVLVELLYLQAIPYSLQVGLLSQGAPEVAQLLDSMGSLGSTRWSDSLDLACMCLVLLSMELPLAARKDLDKTKFAAEL